MTYIDKDILKELDGFKNSREAIEHIRSKYDLSSQEVNRYYNLWANK